MRLEALVDRKLAGQLTSTAPVVGIDIGSRTAKAVLFSDGQVFTASSPTHINMQVTADELLLELLAAARIARRDIDYVVGTGYGRIALRFSELPHQVVTEISCHALGNHVQNTEIQTIVDIGGQDSKVIKVDPVTGAVVAFIMNDKCAAGTGRFLERVAVLLGFGLDEFGTQSAEAASAVDVSSQCVVFAESEVVSLRARGIPRGSIAAGVHHAAALRIRNLLKRIGVVPALSFSGGVSNNIGMRRAIERLLGHPFVQLPIDPIFAGAIGAAVHAQHFARQDHSRSSGVVATHRANLTSLREAIQGRKQELSAPDASRKRVGYLCTYTPQELLHAAGVTPIRLYQMGNSNEVAAGELVTQSVFCDFTKSVLGAFKEQNPLYQGLDKVYTFYTCDCLKKVGEAIGQFFTDSEVYNLPRLRHIRSSRDYYRSELHYFKEDLEALTGTSITEESLWQQIRAFNTARQLLRDISELRKRPDPPLTGQDYLDLVSALFYLSGDELIRHYRSIYEELRQTPSIGRRIRLMMSGGIVAEGDRRLFDLLEDSLGARVVIEDHCAGFKCASHQLAEQGDPFQALSDAYLDQSPCARMKPLTERVDESARLAREYEVDGILYVYLKFCPCYGQIKHEFFKRYQELGIPVIELPIDYSSNDHGQLKTRLEAFIEVLRERDRSGRPALSA